MLQPTNESQGSYPESHLGFPTAFEADRERQFRKFDRVIQLSGFDDILATPDSRLNYVDSLTFETFEPLLQHINGIQVNLPRSYRTYADRMQIIVGEDRIPQDIMPAPHHKQELLSVVLEYAQQASTLEDKAFLLAMGIAAVHPFGEGNGRLARSIYYLLTEGYTPKDPKLQKILSEDGENVITPDANVMRPVIMGNLKIDLETHVYNPVSRTPTPRLQVGVGVDNYDPMGTLPEGLDREMAQDVAGMLLQQDMKEMLPFLLAKHGNSPTAMAAIRTPRDNPDNFFFILDQFWANMTADDLESLHTIAYDLKFIYIKKVMEQLSLDDRSAPMLVVDNNGELTMAPVAVTMKRIIKGELDVSPSAIEARMALKATKKAVQQQPRLTRQERRAKERQEAKAARRNKPQL